jgi:hypothetical protein
VIYATGGARWAGAIEARHTKALAAAARSTKIRRANTMSVTLAVAALLATVLACISFLAGTICTDRACDRTYRQLVEERRELNAMLLRSSNSDLPVQPGTSRQTTTRSYDNDDEEIPLSQLGTRRAPS